MTYVVSSRKNPLVVIRVTGWALAVAAWAAGFTFAEGASTVCLIAGLTLGVLVEAWFRFDTLRRAFNPWKRTTPTIRFAKGE